MAWGYFQIHSLAWWDEVYSQRESEVREPKLKNVAKGINGTPRRIVMEIETYEHIW